LTRVQAGEIGIVPRLKERIIGVVNASPGLSDREITDRLSGESAGQQAVNQAAHALANVGLLRRVPRSDGRVGNYPTRLVDVELPKATVPVSDPNGLSEEEVKRAVEAWLVASGWQVTVKWGRTQGIDIDAMKGQSRWIIEAKGCGSLSPMRVNYFVGMLGELLQRMDDPRARYSIALPDMKQFRGLWRRLPALAKSRTSISALFVSSAGHVEEA
jgi:hypothetical protein